MREKIIGVGLILLLSLLIFVPFIRALDLRSVDLFWRLQKPHPDILILAIDSKSLKEIGRWPWPRRVYAQLLEILNGAGPRLAAFDINFSEPSGAADDQLFAQALNSLNFPVILAAEAVSYKDGSLGLTEPLPIFTAAANVSFGHVNLPPSADGLARFFPENLKINGKEIKPFVQELSDRLGAASLPAADWAVNFAGPAGTFPTFSLSDVIFRRLPQENFKDKIILIGATASDLHDLVNAPLKQPLLAGVEWHANLLDNILLRRPLRLSPLWLNWFLGIVLATAVLIYSLRAASGAFLTGAALAAAIAPAAGFFSFRSGFIFPYFFDLFLLAAAFSGQGIYRWYKTELEKRKLRRSVESYFSAPVLETILAHPESLRPGGQRREITILFSDIRSFTTITETIAPETLSQLLQEYFTEMTEEILASDGVVDKFIGDAIMAFWGAPLEQPDHAQRAVRAATGMLRRLRRLRPDWKKKGWPEVDIGVGIHTGQATVGNMGSVKRFEYTVIGDAVNTASRLEGLNKEYKTNIIISEETKNQLKDSTACRYLEEALVKGKTKAVKIYEVVV